MTYIEAPEAQKSGNKHSPFDAPGVSDVLPVETPEFIKDNKIVPPINIKDLFVKYVSTLWKS